MTLKRLIKQLPPCCSRRTFLNGRIHWQMRFNSTRRHSQQRCKRGMLSTQNYENISSHNAKKRFLLLPVIQTKLKQTKPFVILTTTKVGLGWVFKWDFPRNARQFVAQLKRNHNFIDANSEIRIIVKTNVICINAVSLSNITNPFGVRPKPNMPLSTFSLCREIYSAVYLTSSALLWRMKPIPLSSWEIHTCWVSLKSHWWASRADSSGALAFCSCPLQSMASLLKVRDFLNSSMPPLYRIFSVKCAKLNHTWCLVIVWLFNFNKTLQ